MSGHSKWHNIRLRKGKQDAERGKIFTKLAREIIVAAKAGGGNPDANVRLRLAIQKARDNSMPADNIKRAIQRGTGELEGVVYEEVTYEGYGVNGVAVLAQCLTDNRNRTVAELRNVFSKCGGNLGESGSVAWMFDQKGVVTISAEASDEDSIMMATLDAGAEDIRKEDDTIEVITRPEDLQAVRDALNAAGIPFMDAEISMIPKTTVRVEGTKEAGQILRLVEMLEDLDDVQNVYANFDIPDEIMQEVAA
ncbi:MAG TPA: YebC/PmpR family DNA-binding transcriptional regulator [Armatimonadota bacterium]|nr:YebC/PmpR family DNA-binding transcriptional regulator [Armatimonadota bacterium]HPP74835.1 YebC/PmpR family DNA-binding transcriptional regulator [Armatimonadota bacterium]